MSNEENLNCLIKLSSFEIMFPVTVLNSATFSSKFLKSSRTVEEGRQKEAEPYNLVILLTVIKSSELLD